MTHELEDETMLEAKNRIFGSMNFHYSFIELGHDLSWRAVLESLLILQSFFSCYVKSLRDFW